ncbi:hypothetical protein LJC34_07825, partial [Oscillospiraceae bacterium OttesenSCG-928-G22]|nr:hypothetical protein [Oscillospiraceae bacterium OttesenSCG-928-G22]
IKVGVTAENYSGERLSAPTAAVEKLAYSGSPATAAAVSETTTNSITVAVTPGQEYAIVAAGGSEPTTGFMGSGGFTGLSPNTSYDIYTRVVATATMKASDSVKTAGVSTKKLPQSINVTNSTPSLKFSGTLDLSTLCTSNASGATLVYTVGTALTGTSLSGSTVTAGTTAGTFVVKVNSAAIDNYDAAAEQTISISIAEGDPQTLTFSNAGVTKTYGDANFTNAATNDRTDGGAITYASNNTAVATVNASTGEVAILKRGTAIITATAAAKPGVYAEGTRTYLLTVNPKIITASEGTYSVTKVYDGTTGAGTGSGTLAVSGILSGDSGVTVAPGTIPAYGSANVHEGTVALPVSILGDTNGNYTLGSVTTVNVPASITKKTLSGGPTVTVTGSYSFTGSAIEPGFTVTGGGDTLSESDYVAAFSDNVNAGTGTGKITVTPNAGGNYTWTPAKVQAFTIAKAAAATLPDANASHRYTLTDTHTKSVAGLMPADAGTATYAKGTATGNTGIIGTWNVGADGLVSYTLAGGATGNTVTLPVVITTQNYADSTAKVVITLTDKDVPAVNADDITVTYSGTAILDTAITGTATFGGSKVLGSWSFVGSPDLTTANAGIPVTVKFTPEDAATYATAEDTITVTIGKAAPTGTPAYTPITADGKTLLDAALTIGTITPAGGTIAWDAGDAQTVTGNTSYGWTYTPADTANYSNLTGSLIPYVVSTSPVGGGGGTPPKTASEKAIDSIEKANPGDTVKIDLGSKTEVKKEVFEAMAGKDITVEISVDGATWIIDGKGVPKTGLTDLNLGVSVGKSPIPVDVINAITGEKFTVQIELLHDGPFGFTMLLQVSLGAENANFFANLYFYNKDVGEMEFRTASKIGTDGSVRLAFSRASEY